MARKYRYGIGHRKFGRGKHYKDVMVSRGGYRWPS